MYRCNTCRVTGSPEELDAHCLSTHNLTHGDPHYSYSPVDAAAERAQAKKVPEYVDTDSIHAIL